MADFAILSRNAPKDAILARSGSVLGNLQKRGSTIQVLIKIKNGLGNWYLVKIDQNEGLKGKICSLIGSYNN